MSIRFFEPSINYYVDAAFAMLIEKGIPSVSAPHNFLGMLRAAWVMDGNPVEIVSRLEA